jgi:hypothetical protein
MQVIRQNHGRVDVEGMRLPRRPKRRTQGGDVIDQRARLSIRQRHGEEVRPARNEIPAISHHAGRITQISLRPIQATAPTPLPLTLPLPERT